MNFRIPLINILLIAITISVNAREWQQDILGDGFELTYINHGNDYSGPIRSTVIKEQKSRMRQRPKTWNPLCTRI